MSHFHVLLSHALSDLRFWGREFEYDKSAACVRKGGIVPRTGGGALKGQNLVASTSTQPEEQEPPDDEQDGEADEEVVQDESFDVDWSRNLMCVTDPFIVAKVRGPSFITVMPPQCSRLSELCWSDQEVNHQPVHS